MSLMLKMLADMAGVKPEDIEANIEHFKEKVSQGVEALEAINKRLARIEYKMGIGSDVLQIERQENGQENRTTERTS